jgi:amino acid permease
MLIAKFYNFLLDLVGACIIIPWAVLCGTYLVFRKALEDGNYATVPEAESPFQPWLACWGLFWSTMVGITPPLSQY